MQVLIKDFPEYSIDENGNITRYDGYIVKQHLNRGYMNVNLRFNGKQYQRGVHRLLAQVFIPNPNDLPIIDHFDHNRSNNNLSNLRWVNDSESTIHRRPYGKSRYRGVCKNGRNWKSQCEVNGKKKYIGTFSTEREAAITYNEYVEANMLPNELNKIPKLVKIIRKTIIEYYE